MKSKKNLADMLRIKEYYEIFSHFRFTFWKTTIWV